MGLYKLWKVKRRADKALAKFEWTVMNLRRERAGEERILTFKQKLKKKLSYIYPPWRKREPVTFYERIFKQGTSENAVGMLVRNILMVELFGLLIYIILAFKYAHFPGVVGTTVSLIVHVFLFQTLLFPKLMYYFTIAVHCMLSNKIRGLLVILIMVMAFEGPAMNIVQNIHGVASGVACLQADVLGAQHDLQSNLADKGASMVARVRNVMLKVAEPVTKLKRLIGRIDEKATKFVDVMRRNYAIVSGLSNECRRHLEGPFTKCINFFDGGYTSCKDKARFFGSQGGSCDVILATSSICDIAKGFSTSVCNFPQAIKRGVKGAVIPFYVNFFQAVEESVRVLLTFHVQAAEWAFEKVKPAIAVLRQTGGVRLRSNSTKEGSEISAEDDATKSLRSSVKRNLAAIVQQYRSIIGWIVLLFRWGVLPAMLAWPFLYAIFFIYRYNYDDDYKNRFITEEFEKIDQDFAFRKTATKALPLTDDEGKIYVHRDAWKMTHGERTGFWLFVSLTVLSCFTPFCICLLDVGVYNTIYAVHVIVNLTHIDMPSHYELQVSGSGYIAKIMPVRNREEMWRNCFKEPEPPNFLEFAVMLAMFLGALFCCRLKVYFGRQTLALCDYYYPDRVRIRALTLYNKILQDRKNLLAEMMGHRKDDIMGKDDLVVRRTLQSRGYLRSDCTKCKKMDLKVADQSNVRICIACNAFYCIECFSFTSNCTKCDDEMQNIGNLELYYEEEEDDQEQGENLGEKAKMKQFSMEV
ncbi:unnamed protein product [Caenorhabditis auriculariae]|uniref:Dendritic cell-specific transmembrane protein-like domain-containing protein n=1 Tax=Caenorhabditis auriculariae TaxID=2777116 RepID=A0A8S1H3J0_9PELO|nr:unnamed protein product [Caenorhabditis auriculariae]